MTVSFGWSPIQPRGLPSPEVDIITFIFAEDAARRRSCSPATRRGASPPTLLSYRICCARAKRGSGPRLLDHLVGLYEQRGRYLDPERLGGV